MPARLLIALLILALSGCATHVDRLDVRLGLVPPIEPATPGAAVAAAMRADFEAGLAALARDDLDTAIDAWRRHVAAAPRVDPQVRAVRGYLTLLERERAIRHARAVAAREATLADRVGDRLDVAVLPFALTRAHADDTRPFNDAILAMVASDLARVPGLRLLERRRIDALLQELKLSAADLVDPATALRGGRLLGAGSIVVGTVYSGAPPDPVYTGEGEYSISVSVSDVAEGRLLGVQEAYGQRENFFELQKRIVHGVLDILGVTERPADIDRIHTRNWNAYAQFTLGLQYLAEQRYPQARAAFALALRFDPEFTLAEEYHLDTPERLLSVDEIRVAATRR